MVAQNNPKPMIATRAKRAVTWSLLMAGIVLVAFYLVARTHSEVMSQKALRQFSALQAARPAARDPLVEPKYAVNYDLWSTKRITAYEESLSQHFAPPVAVLEIPKIALEVPVFEGTDDLTLNRGVGRIIGTARPGEGGNVGIAGHRDGFFRGLKEVSTGDSIDLVTPRGVEKYMIDRVFIVNPSDTSVLQPRMGSSLTLVTCYPFYFVGSAPQRYIVQAVLADSPRKVAQMEGR